VFIDGGLIFKDSRVPEVEGSSENHLKREY